MLGGPGAVHGVDLGLPINLARAALVYNAFEGVTFTPGAQDSWVVITSPEGHRAVITQDGLLLFRPGDNTDAVWKPEPSLLTPKGPGVRPDLRSLVGYGFLRGLIGRMAEVGMVETANPIRLLNEARHQIELAQPLHLLLTDIMGPNHHPSEQLNPGAKMALIERGLVSPDWDTWLNPAYPRDDEVFLGREINIELKDRATLRGDAMLLPAQQCPGQGMQVALKIDDENKTWKPHQTNFRTWDLEPGPHRLRVAYAQNSECTGGESIRRPHWFRFTIQSTAAITLQSWRPLMPLPVDGNARPILYNEAAGVLIDTDNDGWPNASDLCPKHKDNQRDGDQDGIGDACDGIFSTQLDDGQLTLLNADGDTIRAIDDPQYSRRSFAQVLQLSTRPNYPGSDTVNPHGRELAVVSQTHHGEPTQFIYKNPDLNYSFDTYRIDPQNPESAFKLNSATSLAGHSLMGYSVPAFEEIHSALLSNFTVAINPINTAYLFVGLKPAMVLVPAHHPAVSGLTPYLEGTTTPFAAMRLLPWRLLAKPGMLLEPPTQAPCAQNCPDLDDDGIPMPMVCRAGQCVADDTVGICLSTRLPKDSSFERCTTTTRWGERCVNNRCDGDATCIAGRCVNTQQYTEQGCPTYNVCTPHFLIKHNAILDSTLRISIRAKALALVQPLPAAKHHASTRVLVACLRALTGPDAPDQLTLGQKRALLRAISDPTVAAEELFEIGSLRIEDFDLSNPGACQAERVTWRAHFPANLAPHHATRIDIDGDGIDEIRVGFTLGAASPNSEATLYRCYDFAAQERSVNCAPD
jgi:hypothetical protein